ncbi:siderophore ABC transporter substrate-binding protein [Ensifer sp. ENS07]|jgi:iron complex transport system substrate-binding protein|uniref:Siderophore ABC transporter substrate-binding protein n=1 Tax=Ensifer adhaerens TaxID=106592 RepID=A0A9Q9D8L9_ENSAD|nr:MULTISPECIES: siderophore ABC transporter substrate-binding protein [Ensifer]MBD9594784.1 siderophore ABC transporter substrate-binding protein [Ensifer sp. ENS05]MBD9638080.1 siderophore ABC transporter substrate-binding protein [Ensifer sp. ENS07]USJ22733.1 siderophore ABC transporter substrate-binding protein [Ensifer adhaerens]SDM78772.1 iron complex transport system substrate-binding protein [Ensifer sp. YR511]
MNISPFSNGLRGLLVAAMMTVGGASVATAETLKIEHSSGVTEVEKNPKTVLVYDFGMLETLDMLGVPVAGVPGSAVPPSLEKYKADTYAKIGTLFEPDFEAINAAEPNLVIVGGRSQAKYAEVAKLAPTIDLTSDDKDLIGSVKKNAEILGEIFGKEAEIKASIAKLDSSIEALRGLAAERGTGLILLTTGGKISAYGKGSRFGALHDVFGIKPADPELQVATHGQAVSYEYILETNPDWIFVVDRDAAIGQQAQPAAALLDNELVRQTKAWKDGHVVYLDSAKLYLTASGLKSQQDIVDQLAQALSKK